MLDREPFTELDDPPGTYALVTDLTVLATHRRQASADGFSHGQRRTRELMVRLKSGLACSPGTTPRGDFICARSLGGR
jgi:hypothetical protein